MPRPGCVWPGWVVTALGICLLAGAPVRANSAGQDEIRAAMLLNIARFVNWPAWKLDSAHGQFEVCLAASDPIGPFIDKYIQHQTIDNRPMVVRHVAPGDDLSSCHLLFLGDMGTRWNRHLEADLAHAAVLTISEVPNSARPEQMIGLPVVDEHVHIDVNLGVAQRSGLEISSRLLRLATVTP